MRVGVFGAVIIAAVVAIVAATTLVIVHDGSVTCHRRIQKSDACWKDINEQVRDLEIRVRELEQR